MPRSTCPPRCAGSGEGIATVLAGVALSCSLMKNSSSVAELADTLRGELHRYPPGSRLPSSRALVDRFRVSPVTVYVAVAALVAGGRVVTRPGAGAFRAQAPTDRAPARGDTSWQEVSLSAESAPDQVPRTVDASGLLATLTAAP
ncbi:GntR family transcriptional regulator, partial [Streptomyces sparsus]